MKAVKPIITTKPPKLPDSLRLDKAANDTSAVLINTKPTTKPIRSQDKNNNEPFPEVEVYSEPINPSELLDEISKIFLTYIVMEQEHANAAALWTAFTYFIDVVDIAPLAIINAPERASGKTQLLDLFGRMVCKRLSTSNVTTAALFRSIEKWHPTLMIDEADTFAKNNPELLGVINAGHSRENAFVLRVVGDSHDPKLFPVWGAKALAGINLQKHLTDTTMSRGIIFNMRRKLPTETVMRLRDLNPQIVESVRSKLARFAIDYADQVKVSRPSIPEVLDDRTRDNWGPLFAIAECGGDEWAKKAVASAMMMSASNDPSESAANELLADIADVFYTEDLTRITSADLIAALMSDPEKPWATYNRGKPLSPRQLSEKLSAYAIHSKTVRFGHHTPKGYELAQFTDAFNRYLSPAKLPQQRNSAASASEVEASSVSAVRKPVAYVFDDEY